MCLRINHIVNRKLTITILSLGVSAHCGTCYIVSIYVCIRIFVTLPDINILLF